MTHRLLAALSAEDREDRRRRPAAPGKLVVAQSAE
jgi:hypothetical protein